MTKLDSIRDNLIDEGIPEAVLDTINCKDEITLRLASSIMKVLSEKKRGEKLCKRSLFKGYKRLLLNTLDITVKNNILEYFINISGSDTNVFNLINWGIIECYEEHLSLANYPSSVVSKVLRGICCIIITNEIASSISNSSILPLLFTLLFDHIFSPKTEIKKVIPSYMNKTEAINRLYKSNISKSNIKSTRSFNSSVKSNLLVPSPPSRSSTRSLKSTLRNKHTTFMFDPSIQKLLNIGLSILISLSNYENIRDQLVEEKLLTHLLSNKFINYSDKKTKKQISKILLNISNNNLRICNRHLDIVTSGGLRLILELLLSDNEDFLDNGINIVYNMCVTSEIKVSLCKSNIVKIIIQLCPHVNNILKYRIAHILAEVSLEPAVLFYYIYLE